MKFPNPLSPEGLRVLDDHLLSRSYISGEYEPTQNDVLVFKAIRNEPDETYRNVRRWFHHIQSFGPAALKEFPKTSVQITVEAAEGDEVEFLLLLHPFLPLN